MNTTKKATMSTVKAFIKKNAGALMIRSNYSFDGMVDGLVASEDREFSPVIPSDHCVDQTKGIQGAWFVGSSRDRITPFTNDGLTGFAISNACGSFDLAVKSL